MDMFDEQMKIIKNQGYEFYDPNNFLNEFNKVKKNKKILITIDDGFKSFYNEAWPYLKKNKIPFILFVSTEPVGKKGYMTWDEIKEIDNSDIGYVGHHSHTHEYLIDMTEKEFINDIETATEIFKDKLGYVPAIFSYPFGEYSLFMKNYISKNFEIAFGQHSGIIDNNKDKFELPRFPINEKYGVTSKDLTTLKIRMDEIPVSLALAQAAKETGWGTSRFAQEGNALFGQWTWSGEGLKPKEADENKGHKVMKFNVLQASVRAYQRNLNTHRSYKNFRLARAHLRDKNQPLDSLILSQFLKNYAETGNQYVEVLQKIINQNNLKDFDDAKLLPSSKELESLI